MFSLEEWVSSEDCEFSFRCRRYWRAGPRAWMRFQERCRFGSHSRGVGDALEPLSYFLDPGPGFGVVSCFDIKHHPVLSPVGLQHMNTRDTVDGVTG